jgi:hypothetical protein
MKPNSRVVLGRPAWDQDSGQDLAATRVRLRKGELPMRVPSERPADGTAAGMVSAPALAAATAMGAEERYQISWITPEFDTPHWTGTWRRLLAHSRSHEKIYQTPEFFRFLADSRTSESDQFELFAIWDQCEHKVVGMVPVRISDMALDAKVGNFPLLRVRRRIVRILGSVPMMPDDPALLHHLFAHLLAAFPHCGAVSMQAFPSEMQARLDGDRRHCALVLHGWRACHTVPLPATLPEYLAKLSGKKRYNLTRQYRLLEQATGTLELKRIDRSADVRELVAAIAGLAPESGMAGAITARDYRVLAANRLLLSYVLKSGNEVVAVISGSRYGDTWHVHHIYYAPRYRHLSAGAIAMHSALQNVIAEFAFTCADFGFGTPRQSFASTHVLQDRGHVLVTRRRSVARVVCDAFVRYDNWHAHWVRVLRPLAQRVLGK